MQNTYSYMMLLDWLYQIFSVIFILCFAGSFIHDVWDTLKNGTKINVLKILTTSVICAVILSVVFEYMNKLSISVFIAICFITGIWSNTVVEYILSAKFMKIFLKMLMKNVKATIAKSLSESLDDINKNKVEGEDKEESG